MSTPPIILSKAVISEHLRMGAERGELAMLTRLHVYETKETGERVLQIFSRSSAVYTRDRDCNRTSNILASTWLELVCSSKI